MRMNAASVYRLVWRWHFYAGLIVAPFMLILSVSGLVYLFNDEINDALQANRRFVAPYAEMQPLSRIAEAALSNHPGGTITRLDTPRDASRSIEVYVTPAHGKPVRVFVDPGRAAVLGSHDYYTTVIGIADRLHGSLFMGDFGDAIVELAACWGFILLTTGLYLWWPRGKLSFWQALLPRWGWTGRPFWRSLHGSIGVWTSLLAMFLILTGLPWATIWGGLFRQALESAGIGYPTSFRGYGAPASSAPSIGAETTGAAPWTLAGAPAPRSGGNHGGHGHTVESTASGGAPIGLDRAAQIIAANGMQPPYRLNMPKGDRGVYIAFTYPDQPQGQRSLYIDQYTGAVLGDVGFGDYGWAAQAIELGIQLHMGNYFGRLNQLVMTLPCLGLIVLSLTGPYMWWRRRPRGTLAAPQTPLRLETRTIVAITLGLGLIFPLAGLSLVVVLLLDAVWNVVRKKEAVVG
jgi:uncharacterized iron-regulated membrane protein